MQLQLDLDVTPITPLVFEPTKMIITVKETVEDGVYLIIRLTDENSITVREFVRLYPLSFKSVLTGAYDKVTMKPVIDEEALTQILTSMGWTLNSIN